MYVICACHVLCWPSFVFYGTCAFHYVITPFVPRWLNGLSLFFTIVVLFRYLATIYTLSQEAAQKFFSRVASINVEVPSVAFTVGILFRYLAAIYPFF